VGLAQKLAKHVGISQSTISAVLNGGRSLTKAQVVKLAKSFRVSLLAIVVALALPSTVVGQSRKAKADRGAQPPKLSLWVPAYYYPNGPGLREWDRLIAAATRVPIVAIVNPASGPGDHVDTNIAAAITRARKARVRIVAYIGTQYTRKPLAAVKGEVDTYLRFYPDIQGIHFDEQSSDAKSVDYYAELYRYVRECIPDAIVVNNPGTSCAAEYVARPTSDVVCLFERDRAFEEFRPPNWASRFPASRFCVQAYHVDTEAQMKRALRRAVQLRVGYVYITDDQGPNPYDRLPSYWDAEVEAIRQVNQPTTQ
jgi:transcriptional regulator with XRE-family HTH domain